MTPNKWKTLIVLEVYLLTLVLRPDDIPVLHRLIFVVNGWAIGTISMLISEGKFQWPWSAPPDKEASR